MALNGSTERAPEGYAPAAGEAGAAAEPIFLLMENDAPLTRELAARIGQAGYAARVFHSLEALRHALTEPRPAALLADLALVEGDPAGFRAVREPNTGSAPPVPTLFISARDDFAARLAAVRAGATHYFAMPLDMEPLMATLGELGAAIRPQPYRILLVDDDAELAALYRRELERAGMAVQVAGDAFQAVDALDRFRPELILMDIYMPGCSGLELAAVIRQQDKYTHIPIVFLSSETRAERQLEAMNLGGDEYLTKPVEPWRLLTTVGARVKRGRTLSRLSRQTLSALRELERRRFALDKHCAVSITDTAGRIIYANEKFCDASRYGREALLGQDHRMLNSGHHPAAFFADMWAAISHGRVWQGEIRNRRRDGTFYWADTTIVPFFDESGRVYQYVAIRTDISVGKEVERALKESRERMRLSHVYADVGTWDWDVESGDLHWSECIAPMFGYAPGDLETTYENFVGAVHPQDRKMVTDAVTACVESGAPYDVEHRVLWPDGTVRWLQERGDVARDEHGKPLHMLGVVQDITPRKRAEEALIQARDEAERANRAKSEFLSRMSHELRTPLNVILGFAQLLESDDGAPRSESQRDNVQQILKAGWHLLQLINEVLDLAKIEAGRIDLSLENVNVMEVLDECSTLIASMAARSGIGLHVESGGAESCVVHADRTRLKQALLNLLTNAVKYNREGGTVILALAFPIPGRVRVEVADSGAGLTEDQQRQLFQPFNRLGAEHSEVEGSGIGLTITRHLVELMGGTVGVESTPGMGSVFWIDLGLGVAAALPPAAAAPAAPGEMPATERTVLYVEDNPANLKLMAQILARRPGFRLISAHSAELGLETARAQRPDLIILDVNLPGMDGFEARAKLRLYPETAHIPVIALSASAMPRHVERGLAAGFARYLTKPICIGPFMRTLDDIIGDVQAPRPDATPLET